MNYISVISFISAGHKNNNELKRISRRDLGNLDFSLFTFNFSLAKQDKSEFKIYKFKIQKEASPQVTLTTN